MAFPELVLSGYPPEDLLLRSHFIEECEAALTRVASSCTGPVAVIGAPVRSVAGRGRAQTEPAVANAAAVVCGGSIRAVYKKIHLPNYAVFDEERYFTPGDRVPVVEWGDERFSVNVCEDIWNPGGPTEEAALAGHARLVVNISMSPYHMGKGGERELMLRRRAADAGAFVVYVNGVGGQDELVFDGHSVVGGARRVSGGQGRSVRRAADRGGPGPVFRGYVPGNGRRPRRVPARDRADRRCRPCASARAGCGGGPAAPADGPGRAGHAAAPGRRAGARARFVRRRAWRPQPRPALQGGGGLRRAATGGARLHPQERVPEGGHRSERGYRLRAHRVRSRGCSGSGGGHGSHHALALLRRDTRSDAHILAANLGIDILELPIESIFVPYLETLAPVFAGRAVDVAEENLQARIRGNLLMALSNKFGWLVLTTGNKSEMAVGYATLYGDMAGGFAVIKDVPKTIVYELARYRNALDLNARTDPGVHHRAAPIGRTAPDQTDQDTLPPYEVLDRIVTPTWSGRERGELGARPASTRRRGACRAPHRPQRVQAASGCSGGADHARRPSARTGGCPSPTATKVEHPCMALVSIARA